MRFYSPSLATLALAALASGSASAKPLDSGVLSALSTIQRNADAVAQGRVAGTAVQGPAREIALAWGRIEPALLRNGDVLVETKMANASIAAFESDWQRAKNLRAEATEVRTRIAELVAAAKS